MQTCGRRSNTIAQVGDPPVGPHEKVLAVIYHQGLITQGQRLASGPSAQSGSGFDQSDCDTCLTKPYCSREPSPATSDDDHIGR